MPSSPQALIGIRRTPRTISLSAISSPRRPSRAVCLGASFTGRYEISQFEDLRLFAPLRRRIKRNRSPPHGWYVHTDPLKHKPTRPREFPRYLAFNDPTIRPAIPRSQPDPPAPSGARRRYRPGPYRQGGPDAPTYGRKRHPLTPTGGGI